MSVKDGGPGIAPPSGRVEPQTKGGGVFNVSEPTPRDQMPATPASAKPVPANFGPGPTYGHQN